MATTTADPKISLKLLIDTNSNKVLYAEVGKDFVDFLFGLLELPLGTILALLTEHDIAATYGSLSRVYQNVQNLDEDYLQPNQTKDGLLRPKIGASNTAHTPLLKQCLAMAYPENQTKVSQSHTTSRYDYDSYDGDYGYPYRSVSRTPTVVQGYVKGVVTYMAMDDLMVKPMSSISYISLLNNLKVKDISCLQEETVNVDMDKGLKLLMKAFSKSTTVLTDLFLPIKPTIQSTSRTEPSNVSDMATTTTNPKISLKLLIDTNSNKVVFAEVGKDFVDFLFGLLELPLGTILALLTEHDTVATYGSLSRVYQSVQNLDEDYLQPNQTKDGLLRPKIGASNTDHTPLLKQYLATAYPENQTKGRVSTTPTVVQGYVKGVVTYMVMDDLMVKPMSSISCISLLNNLKVKNISRLQEETVKVDMDKGLKLFMKAFSKSTTVLTDLFLPIKPTIQQLQEDFSP